MKCNIYIFRSR